MALKTYALTTIARQALFLGITPNANQESVLERLINQATEFIERKIGFRIKETAYSNEVYDGDGSQLITLKNRPINSSETFTLQFRESDLNENQWETISSFYYIVDYKTGQIRSLSGTGFSRGKGNYRVSYTAGYDFDNSASFLTDTEAGDLEYACWKLVADAFNKRKGSLGVTAESIGDYSVSFQKTSWEDEEVRSIFDSYGGLELGAGVTPFNI